MQEYKQFINGEWFGSDELIDNINPATQEVIGKIHSATDEQVDQAVAAAKAAFPAWSNTPAKERAAILTRLGKLIEENVPEIAAMETMDTGLTTTITSKQLIPRASNNFYFFADKCQHTDGETYPVEDQMLNYTLIQPVGVCALISPWNVPFMTATWKVGPCLAFGNTAVLKMSELSPITAAKLGELANEAGLPPGVLNIIQGWGRTCGDALVRHPDVRAISFTGGTSTGRTIMERAGLKKYSMELGGKSPVLVFDDADLERALDAALFTIFSINGERCTAGSRVFVQDGIYNEFCQEFARRADRLVVGDPTSPDTNVGALISRDHFAKVSGYVEIGQNEGAEVLAGGIRPTDLDPKFADGNFLRPTVLGNVNNKMRVAQEEIFGPVVCLLPFKDEADGLAQANDNEYGLASYLWTKDVGRVHRLARKIEAGMVFVNSQNVRDLRTPFGGVKSSGTGREGGHYSYEVFCEYKNVCVSFGSHHIPKWGV